MTSPTAGLSYADAVAALTERGRFGISLGLTRVERLMAETGHPERGLRGALVGGTNGKGSVVALVRSALNAAGYRVGTMPKPHLVSYRERIAVDGEPISPADFAAAVARVLPAIDRVAADIGPPTEFEALTAAAIGELARRRVDLAVVEVGMGGRLDATNVLDLGVAAITNVQRDHEQHLGRTLTAIGREKAAIVKPGNLAVTGASGRGLRPILDRCAAVGAPLRRVGPRQAYRGRLIGSDWDGIVVDLRTPERRLRDLRVGLLGAHQAENAAVAVAVLDAIAERWSVDIPDEAVRRGFAEARWPGRLELLDGRRVGHDRVLLDGAHNPAGAEALARALADLGLRRPTIVFGAMRGKDIGSVLRALAPLEPRFVFTRVADAGAHDPATLLEAWRSIGGRGGLTAPDPAAALRVAAGDPLVVAGSLYLVGAVRGMITGTTEEG
ncbi:MAG TPA: folylpolyglutamate synthase/dihydrofolate synthase family protein [Candidatus Limnocylindria bacterium]|nr:folylpolyglutamate synthase/dihydrofolate synthase family protein [Candidatus Limnocylindria bacterium]